MGKAKITLQILIDRLPTNIKVDESTYTNSYTNCKFTDEVYGEWWARPDSILARTNIRHPKKSKADTDKSNSRDIDFVKSKLPDYIKIVESTYVGMKKKAEFIDSTYGSFVGSPDKIINKGGLGHKKRVSAHISSKRLNPVEKIIERLPEHLKLDESTYVNMLTKCTFIDSKYGRFEALPGNIVFHGGRHPKASNKNSKEQLKMKAWVETLGWTTVDSARPFSNSRHEIDIYIPELKIGIEYNGKRWHRGPKEELKMLNKSLRAEQDGIKLIHVWCYEWQNEANRIKLMISAEIAKRLKILQV